MFDEGPMIALRASLLRALLQIAEEAHVADECRCEAEILAPVRRLLGDGGGGRHDDD